MIDEKEKLEKAMNEDMLKEEKNKAYNDYVKKITPTNNIWINLFWAFVVGGGICTFAQYLTNLYMKWGANEEDSALYVVLTLVLISVILTGGGFYSKLTKFAGAGAVVPITGFANSVASSAIEYKKEGQVFGIGCKIFTIAGPVILYGIFSSWILGVIYWVGKIFGML